MAKLLIVDDEKNIQQTVARSSSCATTKWRRPTAAARRWN